MKLLGYPNVSNVKDWEELRNQTAIFFNLLPSIINGGITFKDNITSSGPFNVVITTASEIVSVSHRMGVIPQGYLVIYQDANVTPFAANALRYPWTSTQIFLTAASAVNAKIILI